MNEETRSLTGTANAEKDKQRSVPPEGELQARGFDIEDEAVIPALERLIARSAKTRPGPLSDALSPVMGRSLLKGIFHLVHRVVLLLNHVFLYTVSLRGWRWRMEAWRSGKSFSRVIYEHSLVCRVRQVLLIDRTTGLLLHQAGLDYDIVRDGDMVSSMLTAIQDFAHDSFTAGVDRKLDTIHVGGLTVWVEQGPQAILASIIDGRPYEELRATFRAVLSRIHSRFGRALASFDGDTSGFKATAPLLDLCLRTQTLNVRERILPCTWAVILALLASAASLGIERFMQYRRLDEYLLRLAAEPGITVLHANRRHGRYHVTGLRDPLSNDPTQIAMECGLSQDDLVDHWEAYQALSPELNLMRAKKILSPPPTVVLDIEDGVLEAKGTASAAWIEAATALAPGVPGTTEFRTEHLVDRDYAENTEWQKYLDLLAREPGLAVIEAGRNGRGFYVVGLRDPYAADPVDMLARTRLDTNRVVSTWKHYESVNARLVLRRARDILAPPDGVTLELDGNVLVATGAAPHRWIRDARLLARALAGISGFRSGDLSDTDMAEFEVVRRRVEGRVFRFLVGAPDLWSGQQRDVNAMVADIKELVVSASRLDRGFSVEIRGHTESTGNDAEDSKKSETFARRFYEILKAQSVDMRLFSVVPMGAAVPDAKGHNWDERTKNCCVTFKVTLRET